MGDATAPCRKASGLYRGNWGKVVTSEAYEGLSWAAPEGACTPSSVVVVQSRVCCAQSAFRVADSHEQVTSATPVCGSEQQLQLDRDTGTKRCLHQEPRIDSLVSVSHERSTSFDEIDSGVGSIRQIPSAAARKHRPHAPSRQSSAAGQYPICFPNTSPFRLPTTVGDVAASVLAKGHRRGAAYRQGKGAAALMTGPPSVSES